MDPTGPGLIVTALGLSINEMENVFLFPNKAFAA